MTLQNNDIIKGNNKLCSAMQQNFGGIHCYVIAHENSQKSGDSVFSRQ